MRASTIQVHGVPDQDSDPKRYAVTIQDGAGTTQHRVTLSAADWRILGQGRHSPDSCIEAAFRFLLEREPKEAILESFDLMVITRYFPEFPRVIHEYLPK